MTQERIVGSVFRADHPDHTDLAETLDASRTEPGRFNTSRFGAIYVSREPQTAIDELRRNNGHMKDPCALFVVSLSAARIIDLSDERERGEWQIALDDLTSDDMTRCREVAEAATSSGVEAILWPSATGNGHSLAIFAERFAEGSHIAIVHKFELNPTVLASIEAGVSLAALHPMLSKFPSIARSSSPEPSSERSSR